MKAAFAILLVLHGLAHTMLLIGLAGFTPHDTTSKILFFGNNKPGSSIMWVFAFLHLGLGTGFIASGYGLLKQLDWASSTLFMVAIFATIISALWVRQAVGGLIINGLILVVLLTPTLRSMVML